MIYMGRVLKPQVENNSRANSGTENGCEVAVPEQSPSVEEVSDRSDNSPENAVIKVEEMLDLPRRNSIPVNDYDRLPTIDISFDDPEDEDINGHHRRDTVTVNPYEYQKSIEAIENISSGDEDLDHKLH